MKPRIRKSGATATSPLAASLAPSGAAASSRHPASAERVYPRPEELERGPEHGACPSRAVAGYIRVSSPSQDYAYQRHAIELAARARGMTIDRWYADTASGATMQRPELVRLQCALAAGELAHVWVWRLDRLTRSGIVDTLSIVNEIRRAGATPQSVADGFAFDGGPVGDLVLAVLAFCAQLERDKIAENQAAARARLESQGRSWGRPSLSAAKGDAARALWLQGKTRREIARELKISLTSVRTFIADLEPELRA